ncbi:P-loop nucleoside triphosphate hydrolase superfamily protein [Medicago truncatula]|uniref:P-loop nucleoside triphosphate hydrolase superfamily protein n=1 Tax=Medicago truncatula TaxID=3880 RepID=G7JNJ4_MEDTR|nr:P-loop nucleoside triphosphate hydrolase superfamily protein [Medicago truncatula]
MYLRRIQCRDRRWALLLQPSKYFFRPKFSDHSLLPKTTVKEYSSHGGIIRRDVLGVVKYALSVLKVMEVVQVRIKQVHVNDGANFDKGKSQLDKSGQYVKCTNSHARLGELDQEEWLTNEKLAVESKKKESQFLTKKDSEHTKNLLTECAASHLRHNKFASSYGIHLASSSGRILLQSIPGTELYRERVVRALAQDLQVPLLVLDSSVLAPYDIDDDQSSDSESDDDNAESGEEGSENEDDNDASNEEEWSSTEAKSDASDNEDDVVASAEAALKKVKDAVKKLIPYNVEELEKMVTGGDTRDDTAESSNSDDATSSDKSGSKLRKGARVKYIGPSIEFSDADDREISLSNGQKGEIYEVNGDRVAVIWDINEEKANENEVENLNNSRAKPSVYWINVKDIENDLDAQSHDCYIAVEALCEVLNSKRPLIVYFPDSSQWLHKSVPKSNRNEFFHKVEEMFDRLYGPVVLICGQNKVHSGSKEKEKFTMILPNFGRVAKLPLSLKHLTDGFKGGKTSEEDDINKLFSNVLSVHPPKEENLQTVFKKQLEEDRKIVISRSNLNELRKVLEEHQLSCTDLLHVNTDGIVITKQKAEKLVGWAKNHYLSSCLLPSIKGERLCIPRESLEIAISRMKGMETMSRKSSQNLKNLAKDEFESNFVSAVVAPGEIGVKFDDIGALEDVKKALQELVILPMRRPELFSHGNLLRPCKGILLFGPPGTGKTLLAKALATEAGANFISVTGSTLTSKWFGDAEKLTKALFSFASKLAPVIIFVDEVDSLLGARGGAHEHEATRRMRNEFMAAWDGLRSKENQRILILGATNQGKLCGESNEDSKNISCKKKNLNPDFQYDKLASLTEGYSGSDLKNLCVAAAYRPVQELLEEEKKRDNDTTTSVLRPLNLDDFVQAKSKVGPSVAYDATSMNELRKWNEMYGEGGSRTKSPFGFGDRS